jgi:IclR family acetate operon transcriptional repressor
MRSVNIALRLLEALAERSPGGVADIARRLKIPKSTAHRGLQTLEAAGWASVDEYGRYSLTTHLLTLGLLASRRSGLQESAFPEMEALRDRTGETIHLTVRDHCSAVLVMRAEGTHAVRTMLPLGTRVPLHASSSGHAILASLPDDEVEDVLSTMDGSGTPDAPTGSAPSSAPPLSRADVWRSIRSAREVGYTVTTQSRHGIVGIGSLVKSQVSGDKAAISVSLPVHRLEQWDEDELGSLVRESAQRASAAWQASY